MAVRGNDEMRFRTLHVMGGKVRNDDDKLLADRAPPRRETLKAIVENHPECHEAPMFLLEISTTRQEPKEPSVLGTLNRDDYYSCKQASKRY
jgi:hypothetical protein